MSLMKRMGLTNGDVKDLAVRFEDVRHTKSCRGFNGKGMNYYCICNFFERIMANAWRMFGGEE